MSMTTTAANQNASLASESRIDRAPPAVHAAPARPKRLRSLDALRGFASLAVVAYHAINYGADSRMSGNMPLDSALFRAIYRVLDLGYLGVPLFFVLSGFCIHFRYAAAHAKHGEFDVPVGDFFKRRFSRLYPAYFVALCGTMLLLLAAYVTGKGAYTLSTYGEHPLRAMAIDFGMHASLLHGLHPSFWKSGGNAVYWTLALECFFYLLYIPLIAFRRRTGAFTTLFAVCAMGLIVGTTAELLIPRNNPWNEWFRGSVMTLWCQWVMGVVIAEAYFGIIKLPKWTTSILVSAAVFAVGLYCEFNLPVLSPLAWGVSFAVLLNWCLKVDVAGKWPTDRVMNWLVGTGVFSYSLYLVNLPVRSTTRYLLPGLTKTTNFGRYMIVATLIAVAGYWAAKLFFWCVERHCLNEGGSGTKPTPKPRPIVTVGPTRPVPTSRAA
jgi:peptidoglycan/LPS O-acetylase OafA/YrhL